MMSVRTGGCMCGAVRFEAHLTAHEFGACHCEMCRRWTGSALLGITVPVAAITWTGAEHVARLQSSAWAERAWCSQCGSPLYYHVTGAGPMSANLELSIGLLDDANGLTLSSEIFIDHKPDSYAYSGEHPRLTRKATLARYGISEDDQS